MGAAARAAKLHTRAEGRYLVQKQKVADLRVQTQCVAGRAPRRPIAQRYRTRLVQLTGAASLRGCALRGYATERSGTTNRPQSSIGVTRRLYRLVRLYRRQTAFPTAWERQACPTSYETPVSLTQSANDDRKPCGTQAIWRSESSFDSALLVLFQQRYAMRHKLRTFWSKGSRPTAAVRPPKRV